MTDPRLLVPLADLDGFDPVGLYVLIRTPGASDRRTLMGDYSPNVCHVHERGVGVTVWLDLDETECPSILLDFSNASTRDRYLRWLADEVGLKLGSGAPMWESHYDSGWSDKSTDGWHLSTSMWEDGNEYDAPVWLASMLGLDPRDNSLLPDGSKLVDAIALAESRRHLDK